MNKRDRNPIPVIGICLFLFILYLVFTPGIRAQEPAEATEEVQPGLALNYLCTSNDTVILSARLQFRKEGGFIALQNAGIEFSVTAGDKTVILGTVKTD